MQCVLPLDTEELFLHFLLFQLAAHNSEIPEIWIKLGTPAKIQTRK